MLAVPQHVAGAAPWCTKPFHLHPNPALCVTPVLCYRQLSTGDQLRVIYENLSKDPNSLANLDQVGC